MTNPTLVITKYVCNNSLISLLRIVRHQSPDMLPVFVSLPTTIHIGLVVEDNEALLEMQRIPVTPLVELVATVDEANRPGRADQQRGGYSNCTG